MKTSPSCLLMVMYYLLSCDYEHYGLNITLVLVYYFIIIILNPENMSQETGYRWSPISTAPTFVTRTLRSRARAPHPSVSGNCIALNVLSFLFRKHSLVAGCLLNSISFSISSQTSNVCGNPLGLSKLKTLTRCTGRGGASINTPFDVCVLTFAKATS